MNKQLQAAKLFLLSLSAMGCSLHFRAFGQEQNHRALPPTGRPVFMAAQRLALLCEDWNVFGGFPISTDKTYNVSPQQIIRASSCDSYILGAYDQQIEDSRGDHYHPRPSELDYMKPLVDTSIKYVKDHPEEQDFAATTILKKAEQIILKAQAASTTIK